MYRVLFDVLLYVSEIIVFLYYAQSFFDRKYSFRNTVLGCSIGYTILLLVYFQGNSLLNTILWLVLNFLLFVIFYNVKIKSAVFHSVLMGVIMFTTEWIFIYVITTLLNVDFYSYINNFNVYMLVVVADKLAYSIVCILVAKIFAHKVNSENDDTVFWTLLVVPASSMASLVLFYKITTVVQLTPKLQFAITSVAVLLLFVNIIIFLIYERFISNLDKLNELRAIKQQEEIDRTYLEILENKNESLKVFSHDMKNHLQTIYAMSEKEELKSYILELNSSIEQFAFPGMSKNKILDVIINKYQIICENKKIDIVFDTKTSNLSFIKNSDLSIILNNLLDNAVAAASNSKDKKITVSIFTHNENIQSIRVVNSCDEEPKFRGKTLITSKNDHSSHGYGTKSISRVAKKYDGIYEWFYNSVNREFEAMVVFQKQ